MRGDENLFNREKHLKGQHSMVKLIKKAQSDDETNASTSTVESSASGCPSPAKQQKLDFSCPTPSVSGEELNKLVAGFIVDDMLPISTVDSPS